MENIKWRKRSILFLISQCITLFGSTIVQMAVVWFVTVKTSSGMWVAAFSICSFLPQFLISFLGGVWADRYNKKRLIIFADSLIAIVTVVMFVMMHHISTDTILLASLLVMSIIRSLGAGVQTPAVNAMIPQLVPEDKLMKYNGINATIQAIVQFASPAVAGAVLSFGTLQNVLLIDIITAVIGIGVLLFTVIPKKKTVSERASIFVDMKIGIKYAFTNKLIGKILVIYGLFIFLGVPVGFMSSLLVTRVYGDTYWYLTAVEIVGFVGMAAGGLLMGTWGGFKNRIKTIFIGIGLFGALSVGMGLSRNFILYLALMLLYGIMITMVQTGTTTVIQEKTDENIQGRIFGLMGSMYSGFLPVGMIIFGPLADVVPLEYIMVGSGIGLLVVAVIIRLSKSMYNASKAKIDNEKNNI